MSWEGAKMCSDDIIAPDRSWWGCTVRLCLQINPRTVSCSVVMLQQKKNKEALYDVINLPVSILVCILIFFFFPLSWMQMRRRDGNTGFDRTLKRTRPLNVWLITTTRPSTSPRTSMMAVSAPHTPTHTHADPNGNHGYNWHTNPSWNVVYRLCL